MKLPVSVLFYCAVSLAQTPVPAPVPAPAPRNDELAKAVDHLTWRMSLGDVADVDEVSYTSLPPRNNPNPTAQGAGNP